MDIGNLYFKPIEGSAIEFCPQKEANMSQEHIPSEALTTSSGALVEDNQDSITAGPRKTLR
jgi:hypothetical protein